MFVGAKLCQSAMFMDVCVAYLDHGLLGSSRKSLHDRGLNQSLICPSCLEHFYKFPFSPAMFARNESEKWTIHANKYLFPNKFSCWFPLELNNWCKFFDISICAYLWPTTMKGLVLKSRIRFFGHRWRHWKGIDKASIWVWNLDETAI